jgi:hypothetical protein
LSFQDWNDGTDPLKIFLFLHFQISQAAIEYFHEEPRMAIFLSFLDGVKEVKVMIPVKSNVVSALRVEGALED